MARHYPQKHFSHRRKKSYVQRQETTFQTAKRYGIVAVVSGLGIALATNAWESAQRRQAFLDTLPAGYLFPGATKFAQPGLRRFIAMNQAFPIAWMVTAMGLAVNRIEVANWAGGRM